MSMQMKFYPALAADRLTQLAVESGRKKAAVLRSLIDDASEPDNSAFHEAYEFFTCMGKEIKEAAIAGNIKQVMGLALLIHERGTKLPDIKENASVLLDISEARNASGSPMTFRPFDSREKLVRLSKQANLSMSVVLRCLVLGFILPNAIEKKAYGRLSQVGGYIKHIAYGLKSNFDRWQKLAACGNAICDIAFRKNNVLNSRYINSENLETDKD